MAEQDKIHIVASGDDKDVAKLENTNEGSFEFSMVRRRSLDEVRCMLYPVPKCRPLSFPVFHFVCVSGLVWVS